MSGAGAAPRAAVAASAAPRAEASRNERREVARAQDRRGQGALRAECAEARPARGRVRGAPGRGCRRVRGARGGADRRAGARGRLADRPGPPRRARHLAARAGRAARGRAVRGAALRRRRPGPRAAWPPGWGTGPQPRSGGQATATAPGVSRRCCAIAARRRRSSGARCGRSRRSRPSRRPGRPARPLPPGRRDLRKRIPKAPAPRPRSSSGRDRTNPSGSRGAPAGSTSSSSHPAAAAPCTSSARGGSRTNPSQAGNRRKPRWRVHPTTTPQHHPPRTGHRRTELDLVSRRTLATGARRGSRI